MVKRNSNHRTTSRVSRKNLRFESLEQRQLMAGLNLNLDSASKTLTITGTAERRPAAFEEHGLRLRPARFADPREGESWGSRQTVRHQFAQRHPADESTESTAGDHDDRPFSRRLQSIERVATERSSRVHCQAVLGRSASPIERDSRSRRRVRSEGQNDRDTQTSTDCGQRAIA